MTDEYSAAKRAWGEQREAMQVRARGGGGGACVRRAGLKVLCAPPCARAQAAHAAELVELRSSLQEEANAARESVTRLEDKVCPPPPRSAGGSGSISSGGWRVL
jgi:hypothetical protein